MLKKFDKSKGSLIKLGILIIVAIGLAGLIFYEYKKPPYQDDEGQLGQQESDIQVIEVADGKIVRNVKEGFEVKVPAGWEVGRGPLVDEIIKVQKLGETQKEDTELYDGILLKIYIKDNSQNLSINDYAKKNWGYEPEELNVITINNQEIIKTAEKIVFGQADPNPTIVKDSQVSNFSFTKNKKVYTFSCISSGVNYLNYTNECENLITKNITNQI